MTTHSSSVKCSVFIATSLDGYIARPDGGIDWLDDANASVPPGEDCGYGAFMVTVDALVMGRGTFEKVLEFDGWPYGNTPVYLLSRSMTQLPDGVPDSVELMCVSPAEVVELARERGHQGLYIDGGKTIQGFLNAGLITDITLTTIPILLGSGIRLFGERQGDLTLQHVSTRAFPFGFVQSHYALTDDRSTGDAS